MRLSRREAELAFVAATVVASVAAGFVAAWVSSPLDRTAAGMAGFALGMAWMTWAARSARGDDRG